MADENEAGRRWVVEPPVASGEISLYMAVGDGADLNDEQQAALSALLRSLEAADAEVVGLTSPRWTGPGRDRHDDDEQWAMRL